MVETPTENKVQYGLKNVHIAVITDDGKQLNYEETPWRLRGAVEMTLDPAGENSPFYADDSVYYTATSNQGYTGKMTVALINDEFREKILGEMYDKNGLLVESNNAKQKNFAMMFEFDGDQKATRHVLYNVSVSRPSQSGKTKEDKVEPDTQELEFSAAPDPYTGNAKSKTTVKTPAAFYDKWYEAVPKPDFSATAGTPTK